ncbi:MAG: VacB/RNase II family 3'-5' exoribonuclease [Polyangiaceae bacterium]|nr:VacB/RNase II family 3'-5' exoribonuclease [Polyangiaceae bacterium]
MSSRTEGVVVVHPRGFGFLELEDGRPAAFVAPPDLNPFLAGDRASCVVTEGDGGRLTATALELVHRARIELFGVVVARGKRRYLKVDRQVANTDWPLQGDAAVGDVVVCALRGAEVEVARRVAPADASLEQVIVRHAIRGEFPQACEAAASRAEAAVGAARRDLRELPTITIDAPHSRDLDDALAVVPAAPDGGLRVLVSIADVDALVPEGSPIDAEARLRGTSVYLAGRVLNMLPPRLSEDALSLLPGKDRLALTVELRLDPEGVVTSTDVYESVIRSHARLDYDGVARFLDAGDAGAIPPEVRSTVRWLRTAASRVAATRSARGGVKLLSEEAYVTLDPESHAPLGVSARADTSAHALIERLMVAANEAVARWLVDRGLPGVFRVHDAPEPDEVVKLGEFAENVGFLAGFGDALSPRALAAFEAQFEGTALGPAMTTVLGRCLGPARYTVIPSAHYGLAAPLYLHFTSPIRRYADLAVHRVVKAYLSGRRDQAAGDAALEELSVHLNERARVADRAEKERLWMVAARHFAKRVGERFRGNVVSIKPFGLVVQLQGAGVSGTVDKEALPGGPHAYVAAREALVGATRSFAVGESLEVVVTGASEELGRIELGLAAESG